MLSSIKDFVKMAREDWLTSLCAIVFGATSLIVGQPAVISFLPDAMEPTVVQVSDFVQKLSIVLGLAFAAQSKPNDLQKKDVIPEVLKVNQPEGKVELMQDEFKSVAPKKKTSQKPASKKVAAKSSTKKSTTKPKSKP